jgi:hypothetical protein
MIFIGVSASSLSSKLTVETGVSDGDIAAVCWYVIFSLIFFFLLLLFFFVVVRGGHARDIKRRETEDYVFATAGRNVCLWNLTPSSGELSQLKVCVGR